MKIDSLTPISGVAEIDGLTLASGPDLPEDDGSFEAGKTFVKTGSDAGLHVWSHEATWLRIVS